MKHTGFYNISYYNDSIKFRHYCANCSKLNLVQTPGASLDLKSMLKIKRILPDIQFFSVIENNKIKTGQPSEVIKGRNVSASIPDETMCYCHHCKTIAPAKRDANIGTCAIGKNPIVFFKHVHVQEDYKRVYVNVFCHYNTYFKERLQIHEFMTRFVFNFRIGAVTILPPLDEKGRIPKIFGECKKHNATYGLPFLLFLHMKESKNLVAMFRQYVFPALTRKLQDEFYFIKDDHFDSLFNPENTDYYLNSHYDKSANGPASFKNRYFRSFRNVMNDTIHAFRFHSLPPYFLRGLSTMALRNAYHGNEYSDMIKIFRSASYRSTAQMSNVYKAAKIEAPKSVRKAMTHISDFLRFRKIHEKVERTENLTKIVKARKSIDSVSAFDIELYKRLFVSHYTMQLMNENKKLSKQKAMIKAETLFVKRFSREKELSGEYIRDTIRNLIRLKNEGVSYRIATDHSLKRIHDDTSSLIDKIRRPDKSIYHDEQFLYLEGTYGKFTFHFPRRTHELIDIGVNMNICVGGYDIRAFKKQLNILQVSSEDNLYTCCIEMAADYKSIYQAKTHSNHEPTGQLRQAILEWIEKHKLNILTYDIERSKGDANDFHKQISRAEYPLPLPEEVTEYLKDETSFYQGFNVSLGHVEFSKIDFDELLAM